jgi:hypothetical protein
MLSITKDSHAVLDTGAITVNLHWSVTDDRDYWHLSDYAVSSRSGMVLVMVPRNLPPITHADNGWQHHFKPL